MSRAARGVRAAGVRSLAADDLAERSRALQQFARNLRRERKARGVSQERLALLCSVSWDTTYRLEQGSCEPRLLVLLSLAHQLGVPVEQLLEGVRAPTRRQSAKRLFGFVRRHSGASTYEIAQQLDVSRHYVLALGRMLAAQGRLSLAKDRWRVVYKQRRCQISE